MVFWKKKELKSEEFEVFLKKIALIDAKTEEYMLKMRVFETELANLRGLVSRKIGGKKDEKPENSEEFKTSQVILPYNGNFK